METVSIGLTLKTVEELKDGYVVVSFDKTEPFNYQAGQHGVFELVKPLPTDKNNRVFTFMTHPDEEEIRIAFLKRDPLSEYKSTLIGLGPGSLVRLSGPFGTFVWEEEEQTIYMVTKGIGASVLFSILKDVPSNKKVKVYDVTEKQHVFEDELNDLAENHENVSIQFNQSLEDVKNELKAVEKNETTLFYLSGIMPFLNEMKDFLVEEGVNEKQLRFERYKGYTK